MAGEQKRRHGVLPVWILAGGLASSILMIVMLFGVIVFNGLVVFWPHDVVRLELKGGDALGARILEKGEKAVARDDGPAEEYYLFVGSPEVLGEAFRYLPGDHVLAEDRPDSVVVAERRAYGDALLMPQSLKLASGDLLPVDTPRFWTEFNRVIRENAERRKKIERLESGPMTQVSRTLEQLNIEENQYRAEGDTLSLERIRAERNVLEQEHRELAEQSRLLREPLGADILNYKLLSGEAVTQPVGELIRFYRPNAMSVFDKFLHFLEQFWLFVSDDPREGNTEGGIFPVILGTFILTILMSIVVMPMGVCTAIYLREYAKSGPIVQIVRISVSNLAGVPSIVYGVFGLGFFVYFLGGSIDQLFFADKLPAPTFGTGGILWAALTLALLTVPVVVVATEESLAAFPQGIREASMACGASRFQTLIRVILPASAPGMLTGLVLAVARAAGEVAPLMLVGVVAFAPDLPYDTFEPFLHLERKFMHLGYHIYSLGFLTPGSEAAKPMVFATTLILILLVLALNISAMLLRDRMRQRYRTEAF